MRWSRGIYQLRTCSYDLSPKNIEKGKFKRCLEYHIGNCKAPCEGIADARRSTTLTIDQVRQIVKGRVNGLIRAAEAADGQHAEALEFEKAEAVG